MWAILWARRSPIQASVSPFCKMGTSSHPLPLLSVGMSPQSPFLARGLLSKVNVQKVNGVGCLGSSKLLSWGGSGCLRGPEGQAGEGQDERPRYGFHCLEEGTQAGVWGCGDVYSLVCASVWVAAGSVFWVCVRLCVCACVRVWAGSCQDRAMIVPRPVLPLGARLP